MVDTLKELRGKGEGVSEQDLLDHDFTPEQIAGFGKLAVETARREMLYKAEPRPDYDRRQRLNQARQVIMGLCPDRLTIVAGLQSNAFTHREIEDLLEDAIVLASDDFADLAGKAA
ncbi:hypothetical protein JP74_09055 [Devosia sp. 17-2-E-8]|nr:hypothetical protein JP74_09055 [Devosia sp. 17-2-E-8]